MKIINYKNMLAISTLFIAINSYSAGLLTPQNANYQGLQINTHDVQVTVQDGYSRTAVEQTFYNPNAQALEAIYSFPVPEGAAVGEFTYWIDGKPVHAEVVEKQRAKQIYEQQKQSGKHTALVAQAGYKNFTITVFPVNPLQDTKIRLVYLQKQDIDTGLGRYVYPLEEGGVDQAKQSFWTRDETVQARFTFNMDIRSSYPVDGVRLPAHPNALVSQQDQQQWQVSIGQANQPLGIESVAGKALETQPLSQSLPQPLASEHQPTKLDKDIVVYWRHQPNLPGRVDLINYREKDKKQGTFKLTLTPGDDLAPNQGQRDWVFVLDKSGSMQGKYETLVEGVRQALDRLPTTDRYRIITFDERATDISGGYQAVTATNVQASLERVLEQGVGGGTNLYAGVEKALKKLNADRATALVLVSDGVANVGTTEKKAFLKLLDKRDIRLYSFIMGNSANRPLLEGMSNISNGFYASISNADDMMGQVMLATSKMTHQAMRDIKLSFDGIRVTELSHDNLHTVYRGQQLTFFGHYYGEGKTKVTLTGKVNGQPVRYQTEVDFNQAEQLHPELERLWAYSKIKAIEASMDYLGEDTDSKDAIKNIAVEYGLVTNYTSLLVVEKDVFEQLGIQQSNKQRIQKEHQAQQKKSQQAVKNNRVDTQQPMFNTPSPSLGGGGGGAINPLWMLLLLILKLPQWLPRKNKHS